MTKKQARVLNKAHAELDTLQTLARRRGVGSQPAVYVAIDVEAYEGGNDVLEVGLACIATSDVWPRRLIKSSHWIVEDNLHLHNGRYVPDHRDRFNFGLSQKIPAANICSVLDESFDEMASNSTNFLIGHTIQSDIKWLSQVGINILSKIESICDVAGAFQAINNRHQPMSLANMLEFYSLSAHHLHNAGNDASYTLELALQMMADEDRKRFGDDILLL